MICFTFSSTAAMSLPRLIRFDFQSSARCKRPSQPASKKSITEKTFSSPAASSGGVPGNFQMPLHWKKANV